MVSARRLALNSRLAHDIAIANDDLAMSSYQPPGRTTEPLSEKTDSGDFASSKAPRLDVPTSQPVASSTTDSSGVTAGDPADVTDRPGSKRSFIGRRAGSTASSKRSQNAQAADTTRGQQSAAPASRTQAPQQRPKKKSFLSFLNCCSSDDTNEPDMDNPPHETKPPVQSTPNPVSQRPAVAQSATVSEKHPQDAQPINEKPAAGPPVLPNPSTPIVSPPQEDLPYDNATEDPMAMGAPATLPEVSKPMSQPISQPVGGLDGKQNEPWTEERYQTSASAVPIAAAAGVAGAAGVTGLAAGNAYKSEHDPTTEPSAAVSAQDPTKAEESVITDRTPQQEAIDTDIEMTDVGPTIPLSVSEASTLPQDSTQVNANAKRESHVDLPPPPPLEERQAQLAPAMNVASPSQETSGQSSPMETQKWLLPPMRAEHKGRKCLILDLDETLVHSSFKVRLTFVSITYDY